jgi:DNA segregation ATPase FtsK/SpoIIIE, S-DNA-T family
MLTFSVTEVRNALRCPRIFALGRAQRREVGFPVSASSLGAAFHRIVGTFANTVSNPAPALAALGAAVEEQELSGVLAATLLDGAAAEIERNPSYASMPAEVDELAESLRELGQYLAHELKGIDEPPAVALARFFAAVELELGDTVDLGGGEAVLLLGRLDALHGRSGGTVDVVEYKLTPEADLALDRAQVALYRHLLRESREIDAEPVILRFQPRLTVTRIPAQEADSLLRERLLPLLRDMSAWAGDGASAPGPEQPDLCPSCPVRAVCAATYPAYLQSRDQPPAGAARPLPDAKGDSVVAPAATRPSGAREEDRAGGVEAEELQKAVERIYRGQGVAVSMAEVKLGPRLVSLEVRAKRGPVRNVDRSAEDVVHRLEAELGVRANYMRSGGLRRFEVARRIPRPVLLSAVLDRAAVYLRERPGRFVLGEDIAGDALCGDLSEPASCHLLIGGATGSGKSVLLRTLIASLAQYHAPDAIRFTLVDPKRVSFASFRSALGAHLAHPLCFEAAQAVEILEGLVNEMEERYKAFEEAEVEDLDAYNEIVPPAQAIARHVVAIDEFADLLATKALRESFLTAVQRLCAKARAAGIHLVLATQRPEAKTVPGVIKTNLVGRIALKVPDATASRIVIGQVGAEKLLGKGDLYADFGCGPVRAQAATLNPAS